MSAKKLILSDDLIRTPEFEAVLKSLGVDQDKSYKSIEIKLTHNDAVVIKTEFYGESE